MRLAAPVARLETEEAAPIPTLTAEEAAAVDAATLGNAIALLEGACVPLRRGSRRVRVACIHRIHMRGRAARGWAARRGPTATVADKLKNSKPNLTVIQQFVEMERDYLGKVADLNAITASRDQVKGAYDELRKRRLDTFMTGFTTITLKLKEMYQMITLGGNAELELVDSLDPFSEGIVFSVMPPKKSWKNIANLSGGEKVRRRRLSGGKKAR